MPVKALWEMFMARRAGKKLVPLAAVPDTLLGSGPLHACRTHTQHLLQRMCTQEVLPSCAVPCRSRWAEQIAHKAPRL